MKKIPFVLITMALAFSLAGCSSKPTGRIILDYGMGRMDVIHIDRSTKASTLTGTPADSFFAGDLNGSLVFQNLENKRTALYDEASHSFSYLPSPGKLQETANILLSETETTFKVVDNGLSAPVLSGYTLSRAGEQSPIMSLDFNEARWAGKIIQQVTPSPDGTKVILEYREHGQGDYAHLLVYDPDSGAVPLSTQGDGQSFAGFSPDGKKVAYESYSQTMAPQIRIKNLETGEDLIFYSGGPEVQQYWWSPDSNFLAIAYLTREDSGPQNMNLVIVDTEKATAVPDSILVYRTSGAAWSPDSKFLAVLSWGSESNPKSGIYIFNSGAKLVQQIVDQFPVNEDPMFVYWIK